MTNPPNNRKVRPAFACGLRIGVRYYELRFVDCGKKDCHKCQTANGRHPSHGPYWYLRATRPGPGSKRPSIYLGKELDTTRFIRQDGSVDWEAAANRPRRSPPAPEIDQVFPPEPKEPARGAAHVETLEQPFNQAPPADPKLLSHDSS